MLKTTTSTPAKEEGYALGEEITYEIVVKNTGNLTLTDVVVTDEKTGDEWKIETFVVGATETYEASYTVTEADILAGEVVNVAVATAKTPDPDEPEVSDEDDAEDETEPKNPAIEVLKTVIAIGENTENLRDQHQGPADVGWFRETTA